MRDLTGQPAEARGGEDSFSLLPVFEGKPQNGRQSLVSHSIRGSFAIREGTWKLCLSAGSGGWSAPREAQAKQQNLPPMQLYDLQSDRGEQANLLEQHPDRVAALLQLLTKQVAEGRSTPGRPVSNDRDVTFLPKGVSLPATD
jgi:arylsulfatase A